MSIQKVSRRWFAGLAVAAACALGLSSTARADLVIRVTYAGSDFDFIAGGADALTLDQGTLDALNADLAFLGADFLFTSLSATTSSPIGNPGTLTQDATIENNNGPDTVTVTATSTDYVTGVPTAIMTSGQSTGFTNTTAEDSTSFTSWFNPSNVEFAQEQPSPTVTLTSEGGIAQNNQAGDAAPTAVTPETTYGLTNSMVINLVGRTATNIPATIQTQGQTTVLAVPEPASVAMVLASFPLVLVGTLRRRRAK